MKREVKFRGKRLDNGEWVYGSLVRNSDTFVIINESQWSFDPNCGNVAVWLDVGDNEVREKTVGQYIGRKDRNGKDIYDGDIIAIKGNYPRVVLWDKVGWALMPCEYYHDKVFWAMNLQHPGPDWWELFADEIEVIGNIHDNPDLMKGGE